MTPATMTSAGAPRREESELRRILLGLWGRLSSEERESLVAEARALFRKGLERKRQQ